MSTDRRKGIHRLSFPRLSFLPSERRALLIFLDLSILFAGLWAYLLWKTGPSQLHWIWLLLLGGLWYMFATWFQIYDLAQAASPLHAAWGVAQTGLLTTVSFLLIPYITPEFPERRLDLLLFPLTSISGLVLWRVFYALVFVQPAFHRRILVVGAGWAGDALAQAIREQHRETGNPHQGTGYHLLGFVDDNPDKRGRMVQGSPVLGSRRELRALVQELHPDEIVIAITHPQAIHPELMQVILEVRELGVRICSMHHLYEAITGRVPVEHVGRNLSVALPMSRPIGYPVYQVCRRILDIGVGILGCAFVLVFIPPLWLANRLSSPGPLFYRQARVGQAGQIFQIVKFRTMVPDAEGDGKARWAEEDDPRITSVGRLLRRTRLDEMPQFWNILRGEMTLIGPRPERPQFVAQLAEEIPFYRVRHAVKPGLTGWAQVRYRYGASTEDALIKLQYDLYYIKHLSPLLDIQIVLETIRVILGFQGR